MFYKNALKGCAENICFLHCLCLNWGLRHSNVIRCRVNSPTLQVRKLRACPQPGVRKRKESAKCREMFFFKWHLREKFVFNPISVGEPH